MMKKSLFGAMLMGFVLTCVPTFVEASPSSSSSSSKKSEKGEKGEIPSNPKFVEYQGSDGITWTMRIDGLGKKGDDEGFIQYDKYDFEKANIITNVSVKGMTSVKGVGEALKKHLLEKYKESSFESDLTGTNRTRLLGLWTKSAPSSDEMRKEVPALSTKFGNDFDFEIKAYPSKSGGSIHLVVKPHGSGKATVVNPEDMTEMAQPKEDTKKSEPSKGSKSKKSKH